MCMPPPNGNELAGESGRDRSNRVHDGAGVEEAEMTGRVHNLAGVMRSHVRPNGAQPVPVEVGGPHTGGTPS